MPARERLSELGERKRLVLARAELHREALAFARDQLRDRWSNAASFATRNRCWLLGGIIVGYALLARRSRTLAGWVPAVFSVWRTLRP